MSNVVDDVKETGGSSFLTEFGLCEPNSDPHSTGSAECEFVMKTAEHHQSWTYWDSKFFGHDGAVWWTVVRPFALANARAVAGVPLLTEFSVTTGEFTLRYSINYITETTGVFVPKLHYPQGFEISLSDGL